MTRWLSRSPTGTTWPWSSQGGDTTDDDNRGHGDAAGARDGACHRRGGAGLRSLHGSGDRHEADRAATEAMRRTLEDVEVAGTIVIGEGERDEAPMLWIGEPVGEEARSAGDRYRGRPARRDKPAADGLANAITVLAASERGGLIDAPDTYLDKLCVGPGAAGQVDIRDKPAVTLERMAAASGRRVADLTVVILERPRHEKLIEEVRGAGARIKLISDGDLSAAISCAVSGTGVHAVMGMGGAPEGVITAAALRCLGGEIQRASASATTMSASGPGAWASTPTKNASTRRPTSHLAKRSSSRPRALPRATA